MDEQGVKIADIPLPAMIGGKWVVIVVSLIEGLFEAAKEGSHGQIDATVSIVDGGVDEDGVTGGVAEEVAGS